MINKLTGKKRTVVDQSAFRDLNRDPTSDQIILSSQYKSNIYLDYAEADTVRVGLGKYWDYQLKENGEAEFNNSHNPANVFCGAHMQIDYCEDSPTAIPPDVGSNGVGGTRQRLVLSASPSNNNIESSFKFLYPNSTFEALQQYGNQNYFWAYLMKYGVIAPDGTQYAPIIKTNQLFRDHFHEAAAPYTPQELENETPYGKAFYADYKTFYNSRAPSNSDKQAAAKGSVLSTISGLTSYETFIANEGIQNCLPNIYAVPKIANNPILSSNNFFNLGEIIHGGADGNNEDAPVKLLDYYLFVPDSADTAKARGRIRNDTYAELFKYYPLEASALLYGALGFRYRTMGNPQYNAAMITMLENYNFSPLKAGDFTFEELLKLDPKKTDSNSLFREWHNNFQYILSNDPNFNFELAENQTNPPSNRYGFKPITKIGALEYSNSILAFSPYSLNSILNKAEQYKNFFPMHFEMNFTAELNTSIGDKMRDLRMSKFFMTQIARTFTPYGLYEDQSGFDQDFDLLRAFALDRSDMYNFVDYTQKNIYPDPRLQDLDSLSIPVLEDDSPYSQNSKKVIDFLSLIDDWIDEDTEDEAQILTTEGASLDSSSESPVVHGEEYGDQNAAWNLDVSNYFTYIRNNIDEPTALDSDTNALIKALAPTAFKEMIINKYQEVKRSYKDIIDGVPAYTEDLFYVIRKYRNSFSGGVANVQNIIIPNTSELDIVKYIDTQVKYGSDATFTYDVYCYRLVFGSRYKYSFLQGTQEPLAGTSTGDEVLSTITNTINSAGSETSLTNGMLLQSLGDWSVGLGEYPTESSTKYTATANVDIFPSIQLVEDRIFSTPEVRILDNPPVPPHVNIVPYRAKNNIVKIMLNSQSDTFREEPIKILENDIISFNELLQSQFSTDGKLQFSSDDTISSYEVFRIESRPQTYSDFILHPEVPLVQGSFAFFDDIIMPNKKYYYTFRAVDDHGHFSNPSPVFEVELIDEKGAVKPIIRTVSMEPVANKTPAKDFQKYIYIKPTINQIYFPDSENVNSIFSENKTEKSKKYKMRLTSKKTGKQIDINFSFEKKVKSNIPV